LAEQKITPRYTVIEDACGDFTDAATHLHEVQPQVTLLYTDPERLVPDLFQTSTLTAPVALRRGICDAAVELLSDRIGALRTGTGGTLLVTDLPMPLHSPLGIQDTAVEMGLRACISQINRDVARRIRRLPRVRMLSFSSVVQRAGSEAIDLGMWNLGASQWTANVFQGLAEEFNRHLFAMLGRTRTVLVLEGDGVLWGGSAEEHGATGIELSNRDRTRQFIRVQEACLNLRRRGVQLALATRTSREDVLDALTQHPHMRLKPSDFAHMEMRWTDKATMIRKIAEVLQVEEDRMVYVDANASECSWIRSTMLDVDVISFDSPAELVESLATHMAFESDRLFLEAEPPLTHLEPWTASNNTAGFIEGIEGYLESLETRVTVGMASRFDLPKLLAAFEDADVVDLTGRTLSPNVAQMAAQNPRCQVWWIRLEDRFEESSVVGLGVFHRGEEVWTLQHFLLSAHVMARGVDSAVMSAIGEVAKGDGANRIEVHCQRRPNQQSIPGSSFEAMGLERTGFSDNGLSYTLSLEGQALSKLWRPSYVQCTTICATNVNEAAA
jgi:FkbH-like protein